MGGVWRRHEPMGRHTSWRLGGQAECYFRPDDVNALLGFVRELPPSAALLWLGRGSNLLVRDGGFRGTVVDTSHAFGRLEQLDARRVWVGAGVGCARLARFCARRDLAGAEFMAGIPGTVGGALAMNAGAFAGETWNLVEQVELIDLDAGATLRRCRRDAFAVAYRSVGLSPRHGFSGACLRLEPGEPGAGRRRIRELLLLRAARQPVNRPSCGSVFRNPPGDHAARLIEDCGLKGARCGAAVVSTQHANFIINTGEATATEVESLILHLQRVVAQRRGVSLRAEVCIVGEPAAELPLPVEAAA